MDKPERILSIDVFRGLTILAMVFVNDMEHFVHVPAWMKHTPENISGMTFVDVIFPAFLFIVGMAIPLALKKRVENNEPVLKTLGHIFIRTLNLLIIGVFMVNMYTINGEATGIPSACWTFLMFIGVILAWNQYPANDTIIVIPTKVGIHFLNIDKKRWFNLLRILGIALLLYLAIIYRQKDGENIIGMRTSWWGILGLIGWAYFTTSVGYLCFRKHIAGMVGFLGLMIALYFGDNSGILDSLKFLSNIRQYLCLGGQIGGHSSITIAGTIVGMVFLGSALKENVWQKIRWLLVFSIGLFIAGFLLTNPYGIHKNAATPTWCLYSSSICCIVYLFLYWLLDVKGITQWSRFVVVVGKNAILAYILPDMVYALYSIIGIGFLHHDLNYTILNISRAIVFSFLIAGATNLLYKWNVRLRA